MCTGARCGRQGVSTSRGDDPACAGPVQCDVPTPQWLEGGAEEGSESWQEGVRGESGVTDTNRMGLPAYR
eukprot:COSAG01_NODE_2233_length_8112_cov_41.569699_11_plen_70_part_00